MDDSKTTQKARELEALCRLKKMREEKTLKLWNAPEAIARRERERLMEERRGR